MKKLLTTLLLCGASLSANASECKWKQVIDVERWFHSHQIVESRRIFLKSIVDNRYVVFDRFQIVVDVRGSNISSAKYNQTLYSLIKGNGHRLIGEVGKKDFTNLAGFQVEKAIFEVVGVEEFLDKCRTKQERSILVDYDVRNK